LKSDYQQLQASLVFIFLNPPKTEIVITLYFYSALSFPKVVYKLQHDQFGIESINTLALDEHDLVFRLGTRENFLNISEDFMRR
jgi:hypothetical protein